MEETKSNWTCVGDYMEGQTPITLGRYSSYWYYRSPRRMLHCLSYYKFAAKLIGSSKKVMDFGCSEGLGTWVIGKECGYALGVDFDQEALDNAKANFQDPSVDFVKEDILTYKGQQDWDAVVNFDVIEHIFPAHAEDFFSSLKSHLKPEGLAVIGTPSQISQQFASEVSKKGHVNIYTPERLEQEMRKHFSFVFMFAANDEVVHTGYMPLAHYLIAVGCKKK